jgi:hypothetical protein
MSPIPDGRRRQLELVHDGNDRDSFIIGELDELEANITAQLQGHQADIRTVLDEFRQDYRADIKSLKDELQMRDDKTNKRITAMQGMLVGAMGSTTVAAVIGILNLIA